MDLSDYESLRPGRQALLPLSWGRALPGEVAQLLLGLGQAANEAGLALQDAQALWARISDVQDRRDWLNPSERQAWPSGPSQKTCSTPRCTTSRS